MLRRGAPLILAALLACARAPDLRERPLIFYPLPPDTPRVQYLATIASTADLPRRTSAFADFVLGAESTATRLWKPYGVAMRGQRLYVCDTILNNVLIFDLAEGTIEALSSNLGAETLRNPINITIAPDGMKYVADPLRHQVVVFDDRDRYVTAWGDPDEVAPCDVAVAGDLLFVADIASHEIEVWDRATGEHLRTIGEEGNEPGQFAAPTNLALAPDGTLCVTDTHNFRVQRLTLEGEPLSVIGGIGTGLGQFTRPKGIAVDPEGRICVADAAFSNVQVFDRDGALLMFIGGPGPDRSNLDLPADVEVVTDPEAIALFEESVEPGHRLSHLILVSSQFVSRPGVNVYGFLAQPEGGAAAGTR